MTRKKVREHLFKLLFLLDFYSKTELDDQVSTYLSDIGNDADAAEESQERLEKVREELKQKFYAVAEHLEEIDRKICLLYTSPSPRD